MTGIAIALCIAFFFLGFLLASAYPQDRPALRQIIRQEINKSKTEHGDRIFAKEDEDGLRS